MYGWNQDEIWRMCLMYNFGAKLEFLTYSGGHFHKINGLSGTKIQIWRQNYIAGIHKQYI